VHGGGGSGGRVHVHGGAQLVAQDEAADGAARLDELLLLVVCGGGAFVRRFLGAKRLSEGATERARRVVADPPTADPPTNRRLTSLSDIHRPVPPISSTDTTNPVPRSSASIVARGRVGVRCREPLQVEVAPLSAAAILVVVVVISSLVGR